MKKTLIMLAVMLFLTALQAMAQSVSYAKSLIEQGSYLEAAKQLRPLADGGDAEAQYLAATLFFEGKGVAKNDEQGVKYATLSANQGNTSAMLLLADHYKGKGQLQKYYATLEHYVTRHPYLRKEFVGLRLAECYMRGWGVEQDEEKAWEMASENKNFSRMKSAYASQWQAYMNRHPELFSTQVYDNINVRRGPDFCQIIRVVFEAERTIVYLRFTNLNRRVPQSVATDPHITYIEAGGKRFQCTGSSLNNTVTLGYNKSKDYQMYFEPVRRDVDSFNLIEDTNGGWHWMGVTFR